MKIIYCYTQEVASRCAKEGLISRRMTSRKKNPERLALKLFPWTLE